MILSRDPNYRRAKAGGRGTFCTTSYWLGPDHLLVVEVAGYVERYRRFYYRDVQAIIVQQTRMQAMANLAFGVVMLFSLVGILIVAADQGARTWGAGAYAGAFTLGFVALMMLLAILVNLLRGPTCACHIYTAVQAFELPRVGRWRTAQRLLHDLSANIKAVQPVREESEGASPLRGSSGLEHSGDLAESSGGS